MKPLSKTLSEVDPDLVINSLWMQLPLQVRESLLSMLSRMLARQLRPSISTKEDEHDTRDDERI
jgi:hypothetical protein